MINKLLKYPGLYINIFSIYFFFTNSSLSLLSKIGIVFLCIILLAFAKKMDKIFSMENKKSNDFFYKLINNAVELMCIIINIALLIYTKKNVFILIVLSFIGILFIKVLVRRRLKKIIIKKYKFYNHLYNILKSKTNLNKYFRILEGKLEKYNLIVESIDYNFNKTNIKEPCLILSKHLLDNVNWSNKAFYIKLLNGKDIKISRGYKYDIPHYNINVKHYDSIYGIYNKIGKQYIIEKFRNNHNVKKESKKINSFINSNDENFHNETISLDNNNYYRWASGGAIPIAHYKHKDWFVLNFRGIYPIGWNIANGASEKELEFDKLTAISRREFFEEMCLIKNPYDNPNCIRRKIFIASNDDSLDDKMKKRITSEEFIEKHIRMRKNQDNLKFDYNIEERDVVSLDEINTNYTVILQDNNDNKKYLTHSVFVINPYEQGIEYINIYKFNMEDDDYIIFGEILEDMNCLAREPVMLLSCDYVKSVYNKEKSLGKIIYDVEEYNKEKFDKDEIAKDINNYYECKQIMDIPESEYHIFGYDIDQRIKRVEYLERTIKNSKKHSKKQIEMKQNELKFHKRWLKNYSEYFKYDKDKKVYTLNNGAGESNNLKPTLSLCPTTWKTLEIICNSLNNINM